MTHGTHVTHETTSAKVTGELVATFLAGAWRFKPPDLDLSRHEVEKIAPFLLRSGAAGLGWRRLCGGELQDFEAASELRQAYRLYTLQSRVNKTKIEKVFKLLRAAGVEPILIKGWAAARHYPEPGLRPYGDIDVCVRKENYLGAHAALRDLDPAKFRVDLHAGFAKFGIRQEEKLYARTELADMDGAEIRILGAEDHLRVVCFHLMREGAWRPLWLVDVAAALESRPQSFDWAYCFGERLQARPVAGAIALAHLLLRADIDGIPEAQRFDKTPRWLRATVLNEWGSLKPTMLRRHDEPMMSHLRNQSNLLEGLRHRWPNAIEATTTMNAPFNNLARFPFQIGSSLLHLGAFLMRLPKSWKK
jgi:hypothetical protein